MKINFEMIKQTGDKIIDRLKRNKKKIIGSIVGLAVVSIGCTALAGGYLYNKANLNTNYTEEQASEIALSEYNGTVVNIKKDFELDFDDSKVEYEVTIKDNNNKLVEVTVDGTYGAITDIDGDTTIK